MIQRRLQAKLLVLITIVITVACLFFVWKKSSDTRAALQEHADSQMASRLAESGRLLALADTLVKQRVDTAIQLLMQKGQALGPAALGDTVTVGDRRVPDLLLGDVGQANHFDLVDKVTSLAGGTATLFVKDGNDFVRVSTNVMTQGRRAVGTVLDPKGKVIQAVRSGQPFYGQVDILGAPYVTAYVPIRSAANDIIGLWYVGYQADLEALAEAMRQSRILSQGVIVVLDDHHELRLSSREVSADLLNQLKSDAPKGWVVGKTTYAPWHYTVIAAYPEEEVDAAVAAAIVEIVLTTVAAGIVMLIILYVFTDRLVIRPIRAAMDVAAKIAGGRLDNTISSNSDDEIGQLMRSLAAMQDSLSTFVRNVVNASSDVANSTGQVMSATSATLQGVLDQRLRSDQIAAAITQMSASVTQVANNAARAAEATQTVDQAAAKGQSVVNEAVESDRNLSVGGGRCAPGGERGCQRYRRYRRRSGCDSQHCRSN